MSPPFDFISIPIFNFFLQKLVSSLGFGLIVQGFSSESIYGTGSIGSLKLIISIFFSKLLYTGILLVVLLLCIDVF